MRRKHKNADKESSQGLSGAKEDGRKSKDKGEKGEKSKERKHKEILKDANGNDLKRPLTAYMLFNNFRRPVLQKDHPGKSPAFALSFAADFSLTDLSKLIGQEWKNLNEDQRKVSFPPFCPFLPILSVCKSAVNWLPQGPAAGAKP